MERDLEVLEKICEPLKLKCGGGEGTTFYFRRTSGNNLLLLRLPRDKGISKVDGEANDAFSGLWRCSPI